MSSHIEYIKSVMDTYNYTFYIHFLHKDFSTNSENYSGQFYTFLIEYIPVPGIGGCFSRP